MGGIMEYFWVNGAVIPANLAEKYPILAFEFNRQREARNLAKESDLEFLTPQAASHLFDVSSAAVRQARLGGHVGVPFGLYLTDKVVHLLPLRNATEYWEARKRSDFVEELERMRAASHVLGIGGLGYSVLHVHPIISWDHDVS